MAHVDGVNDKFKVGTPTTHYDGRIVVMNSNVYIYLHMYVCTYVDVSVCMVDIHTYNT